MSAPFWTLVQEQYTGLRLLRAHDMSEDCIKEVFRSTVLQAIC